MKRRIELLAPGGDIDSVKAAILAGADAVYCGLDRFNARNRAVNISFDDLQGILRFAHQRNCQVFLTLNVILVENEIPAVFKLLNKLMNTTIDGIIVQDLGLLYIISKYFSGLKIHASTQLTTHNAGQLQFLSTVAVTRVNLSRELNIREIKTLTSMCHVHNILAEVFVHGSYCISFSGLCYMSSVHSGNSGNRGRCSQPCRDQYITTAAGKDFPLNLKDNSAYGDLQELADSGVDSLKIEGRIKKFHYVYTIVDAWRKQLDFFYHNNETIKDNSALYKVFNRDFSNGFLRGNISNDMFIDNPRDNSAIRLSGLKGGSADERLEKAKGDVYDERTEIIHTIENEINKINISKAPLMISLSGAKGMPLKVDIKTPDMEFTVHSSGNLVEVITESLDQASLLKRLKSLNDTEYYIVEIDVKDLQQNLFIPFKELTAIKNKILFSLNHEKENLAPVIIPSLSMSEEKTIKSGLSVLISSKEDLSLADKTTANIYFQLPACLKDNFHDLLKLFISNDRLIPWFPPILAGEDYTLAVEFLHRLKPRYIVTNNSGIAYEAWQAGISWIAGPYLNIVNSFGLLCLKEIFHCSGAFISNEINSAQIRALKKPADFDLYYSIFHPIVLMTSRQCLFQQVGGCEKNKIDDTCLQECEKFSGITNLKSVTSFISKTKGNYHNVYHEKHFMNTEIVTEIPGLFSGFCIDLSELATQTKLRACKPDIIRHFEDLVDGKPGSAAELSRLIYPVTNNQYHKGI